MISEKAYNFCRDPRNVTSELAKNPTEAPLEVAKRLYGTHPELAAGNANKTADIEGKSDLQRAFECGNWGPTRPSELFLSVRSPLSALRSLWEPETDMPCASRYSTMYC